MLPVVRDLVAVQAQVMSSAELSLDARLEGLRRDDVRTALWTKRTLVKTWAMRGTLHLSPRTSCRSWPPRSATGPPTCKPVWLRYFEVTAEQMPRLQDGIGDDPERRSR